MIAIALLTCLSAANSALLIQPGDLEKVESAYVIDVRSAEAYAKGHIPGAVHVDVSAFSGKEGAAPGKLRPIDEVRPLLEKAGLSPEQHVVIYSASSKSVEELRDATRTFWMLEYLGFPNVSVLDGGFERWQAENREIQAEPVTPKPTSLPDLKPREELRASADEVAEAVKSDEAVVLDVRSSQEFEGKKKSPVVEKAGHVPGAKNLPSDDMVDPKANTLSCPNTEEGLESIGVKKGERVVTYCNSGRQASVGYFTLRVLGMDNVALYDGSMSEWTADPARPVEQGPAEKSEQ